MRWSPETGHVPRGFRGGTGSLADVRLILVCAEPGNPYVEETYEHKRHRPADLLHQVYEASCRHQEESVDHFARNIQHIIQIAWPGMSPDEQMRRTFLTDSVLCSIHKRVDGRWKAVEGASVPARIGLECGRRYLTAQLDLFPNARAVALGGKARDRMTRLGIDFVHAFSAAPPGCNMKGALPSWERAVAGLEQ